MVVARTKMMIHEELLRPSPVITLHYSGPNPEKFYNEIHNLLITVFKVSDQMIQEKRFVWRKGDPEVFSVSWEVNKDLDKFTYYNIDVSLKGEVKEGHGKADIEFTASMRTEYPQDTILQKSLLYEFLRMFWHNTFYEPKKAEYHREGRRLMAVFIQKLKELTR